MNIHVSYHIRGQIHVSMLISGCIHDVDLTKSWNCELQLENVAKELQRDEIDKDENKRKTLKISTCFWLYILLFVYLINRLKVKATAH